MSFQVMEAAGYLILLVLIWILLSVTIGSGAQREKEREQEAEELVKRKYQLLTQLQEFRPGMSHSEIMFRRTVDRYCDFYRVSQKSPEREIIREYFENEQRMEILSMPIVTGK